MSFTKNYLEKAWTNNPINKNNLLWQFLTILINDWCGSLNLVISVIFGLSIKAVGCLTERRPRYYENFYKDMIHQHQAMLCWLIHKVYQVIELHILQKQGKLKKNIYVVYLRNIPNTNSKYNI